MPTVHADVSLTEFDADLIADHVGSDAELFHRCALSIFDRDPESFADIVRDVGGAGLSGPDALIDAFLALDIFDRDDYITRLRMECRRIGEKL